MPSDTHLSDTLLPATAPANDAAGTVDTAAIALPMPTGRPVEAVYGNRSVLVAPSGTEAKPQARDTSPLFGGFLTLSIICLLLLFSRHIRVFSGLLATSLFSYRRLEKQYKENSLSIFVTTRIMLILSVLSLGFSGWLLWPFHLVWEGMEAHAPFRIFTTITGGMSGFLLLKALLLHAIDYIGKCKPIMQTILYFGRFYFIAYGFALFPISILMIAIPSGPFFNTLIIIALAITAIMVLLYLLRLIQILFNARVSIFFLILYLCTLEFSPFILLYRFLSIS
ncbi:MAG: DUF4271 domain-containing protein [Prevotellaceae bacterium]|jgi:hypothetical protein|nr:DUF4271 domain-containing protein [Prevotellaceae bacterium]